MSETPSRTRKWVFTALAVVLGFVALEVGLHLVYRVTTGHVFPFATYRATMAEVASGRDSDSTTWDQGGEVERGNGGVEVIHPFLGYVRDPEQGESSISYLGFPVAEIDPLRSRKGVFRVAILGGSVALGLARNGEVTLQTILGADGTEVEVLPLALSGYKQPQQVAVLSHLLGLGAHFDVVVNVDGFNEVALPPTSNLPQGVNPFYPRAWYFRTEGLRDPAVLRGYGRIQLLSDARQEWARTFQRFPSYVISPAIVWRVRDRSLRGEILALDQKMQAGRVDRPDRFLARGPDLGIESGDALYEAIAEHWERNSLVLQALCDGFDMTYIHLLQPNQYLEGSKVLSDWEANNAFTADHPYRQPVVDGYPRLRERVDFLRQQGVDVHDLTMIYAEQSDTMYQDDCCHPNPAGYRILAKYLAGVIEKTRS